MTRHFRKRPVIVQAFQWKGLMTDSADVLIGLDSTGLDGNAPVVCRQCGGLQYEHGEITTLEGVMRICIGDWVITGTQGEHYPCKPDIFAEIYEEVIA